MLTKCLTSSAEKPSCDRNPLEGALSVWSLSPNLRSDHMGNSMKLRMRLYKTSNDVSKKGARKNDALDNYDYSWCQKEKGQRLKTSDLRF